MIEGAWSRFLEYATHARTKPTFGVEERQPKLELAARLREALESVRDGGDWPARLRAALRPPNRHPFESPRYTLLPPRQTRWLADWAHRDPDSLRGPLLGFLDTDRDPVERVGHLAAAADRAARGVGAGDSRPAALARAAALTTGSLLAFATEPRSLPIVRAHFRGLRTLLGLDGPGDAPIADQYAAELEFAREVRERLQSHSDTSVDMLDAQSLIVIAVREQALWNEDPPPDWTARAARGVPADGVYLAACSVYLNEAPYLREWVEFHRLMGVDRFFLYDNGSTDEHREVLAPYIDDGVVTLDEWRASPLDQRTVFDHCLNAHREEARWIAFLDLDEFLFSPTGTPVAEVLRDYEEWPGVGVSWAMFSHGGHRTRPSGLVIESYLLRDREDTGLIKSIVDPLRTVRCESAHWFTYEHGLPVDENGWPLADGLAKSTSFERLRVNHYASRSQEELRDKVDRSLGWKHLHRWRRRDLDGMLDLVPDDSITRWLPELEAALQRVKST